jgi:site-specific DNA recombinase
MKKPTYARFATESQLRSDSPLRLAIYGRFSSDKQKDTSNEAQVELCKMFASRYREFTPAAIRDALVFTDAAITGAADESDRPGLAALLKSWERGEFDVLIAESLSRLCRDEVQAAQLKVRLKQTGVRILTTQGMDTSFPGWEANWLITSYQDSQYRVKLAYEVRRGQADALRRGYHVGDAPYGYARERVLDASGELIGVRLVKDDARIAVIRRIYDERLAGKSGHEIARGLNRDGVPSSRKALWSAAGVMNLLRNKLFKGILFYSEKEYDRPELAVVSDVEWARVQAPQHGGGTTRSGRGGLKCWAGGHFATCGVHDHALSVKHVRGVQYLHCSKCYCEALHTDNGKSLYLPVAGLQNLLLGILKHAFTPDAIDAFRDRIREYQTRLPTEELADIERRLLAVSRSMSRVDDMMLSLDEGDTDREESLKAKLSTFRQERKDLVARREFLTNSLPALDSQVYKLQLSTDPVALLPLLFAHADQAALSVTFAELFRNVKLLPSSESRRYDLSIDFSRANLVASLSGTPCLLSDWETGLFRIIVAPAGVTFYTLLPDGTADVLDCGQTKYCATCDRTLPLSKFYRVNRVTGTRSHQCGACQSARTTAYSRSKRAAARSV